MDHVGLVFLGAGLGIELERGREPLRNVFRRNDVDRAVFRQRLCLLRRQNDIFIVGEHKYVLRVDFLRRRRDVARRRVHGLSALYDAIDKQILEYLRQPLPRADGQHAHLLLFRFALGFQLTVLLQHVFYLRTVELAQLQRVSERHAGRIGMHVHLHHFEVADADDAVAQIHQPLAQSVDIRQRRALF